MSQLLLNILSNVTLPLYPSFFVHFKHTFVTHPVKISRFSITVTPPPRDTSCHPKRNLNVHTGSTLSRCKHVLVLCLTPVTVHMSFSLPQGSFKKQVTRCTTPGNRPCRGKLYPCEQNAKVTLGKE